MAYTISRKSWHFRLYEFHQRWLANRSNIPHQICLCPYMRTLLIWLPLKVGGMTSFLGGVLWLVGWIVYSIWLISTVHGWLIAGEALLAIAIGIGVCIGIFLGYEMAKEKVLDFADDMEHYEPKGIVGQWLKSFHEKICPCFEITE